MAVLRTPQFYKMHGAGNDFILFDNRPGGPESSGDKKPEISLAPQDIAALCARHTGIGADGLMLIEPADRVDFQLSYFNADGSAGEMCGNGGRCAVYLAHRLGIAPACCVFEIQGGLYRGRVGENQRVSLQMQPARVLIPAGELQDLLNEQFRFMTWINTGVPHLVIHYSGPLEQLDVVEWGRYFRRHRRFQPQGSNVNFIVPQGEGALRVRVYERGVENETLACGTGAVASAIAAARQWNWSSPITVASPGGQLAVEFDAALQTIFLEGPVRRVFKGVLQMLPA